jgi:hypothetical protein
MGTLDGLLSLHGVYNKLPNSAGHVVGQLRRFHQKTTANSMFVFRKSPRFSLEH